MKRSYRVEGMTCEGCARSVTTAIRSSAPNADVEVAVELQENRVTVEGLEDEQTIARAIEDAGFTFSGAL